MIYTPASVLDLPPQQRPSWLKRENDLAYAAL